MARLVQDGRHLDYTPGSAIAGGAVVVIDATSNFVGIVTGSGLAAGQLGALDTQGVWEMGKANAGDTFTDGQPVTIAAGAGALGEITASATGPHRVVGAVIAGNLKPKVLINCR